MLRQGRDRRRFGLTFAIFVLFTSVSRADIDVDSELDEVDIDPGDNVCESISGHCTLRAAVMEANQLGGEVIRINLPAGTYHRTLAAAGGDGDESGDLNLTAGQPTLVFQGAGSSKTIIDADHLGRAFWVHSGTSAVFYSLTIRNGTVLTGVGGGIRNEGHLQVTSSVISGNSAPSYGAGIYNSGEFTLLESTLSGNHDAGWGGGLAHVAIAPSGTSSVTRCTISGNSAHISGGGIYTAANAVDLYVANSTISGNGSVTNGGGIGNEGTTWTYNATIAFNEADSDGDGGSGGGVYTTGSFFPRSSAIMGNTHSGSPDLDDCFGTLSLFGQNAVSVINGACNFVPQNDNAAYFVRSVSGLGPLQFDGGPTRTHALLAGSGLIDGGESSADCLNTSLVDQRGGPRGADTLCDLGAFEYGALPVGLIFADDFESDDLLAWN